MKKVCFLVLSLIFLLHFIATGNAEASCPTLPCNCCQCEKIKVCGEVLRNGNGVLQLPSTGNNSCIRCQWSLSVQARRKVRLTFTRFYLGPGDWVKVYDESANSSMQIVKHDSWRQPTDLVSSGRTMVVEFESDRCGESSRIEATYQAIDCGGLIRLDLKKKRQQTVVVKSPRFPRLYPSNANCLWTVISTETLLSARITVEVVNTEFDNDIIRIYDSLDSEAAIYRYTGRLRSAKRHEARNSPGLAVDFVSDKSVTEQGFKLTIRATKGSVCLRPKKLQNGRIAFHNHKRKIGFYCCTGYRLVGVGSSTCVNGRWSPNNLPRCIRITSCPSPDPPDNSHTACGEKQNKIGSVVQFRCNWGYRFVGTTAKTVTATCDCSGWWKYEPVVPRCEEGFSSASAQQPRHGASDGKAVAVNAGCSNVIYAIDCSRRMNKTGFNYSLEFVTMSLTLFDIDRGQANIALFTYDDKVYTHFKLGEINDTERAVKAINFVPYCGTARTSPSLVLLKIAKEIKLRSNDSCKTAVFILTNGYTADCSGDLINASTRIKEIPNVKIYTIAFGDSTVYWDILSSLASNKNYVILIRHPGDVRNAVAEAHDVRIDYSVQCGTTNAPDCRARVIGGCFSKNGAWPWMVGIYIKTGKGYNFMCGGSLIDDCWVLTAAHCFNNVLNENVIAVLGDTDRFQREFTEHTYDVEAIHRHTAFNKTTFDNNVALLKLKCRVSYKSQVRKICLPRSGDEQYYASGTSCIVAGWGSTNVYNPGAGYTDPRSTSLKHVSLPVQDIGICRSATTYLVTDNMFCAGSGNHDRNVVTAACSGDSGGPLFCRRKGQGTATYVITGVVSWGDGCGLKGKYGYYTHVMRTMKWIDTIMKIYVGCSYTFESCPPPRRNIF